MSFVLGNTLIKRNSSGFAIPTFETHEWRMQWKNTRRPRTPLDFDAITTGAFVQCAPNVDDIATGMGVCLRSHRIPPDGDSGQAKLKDKQKLSFLDSFDLFVRVRTRLPRDCKTVK